MPRGGVSPTRVPRRRPRRRRPPDPRPARAARPVAPPGRRPRLLARIPVARRARPAHAVGHRHGRSGRQAGCRRWRTSAGATSARGSPRRAFSISSWPPGWVTSTRRGRRATCARGRPADRRSKRAESRLLEVLGHLAAEARRDAEAVRLCEQAHRRRRPSRPRAGPGRRCTRPSGARTPGLGQMNRSIEVLRAAFDEARAEPGRSRASPCGSECSLRAPTPTPASADEAYRDARPDQGANGMC